MPIVVTAIAALDDILYHMRQREGRYHLWYVGVAPDAHKRLFHDHHVRQAGGSWIFRTCPNHVAAHTVLRELVQLGCDGDDDATLLGLQVYAYLKTPETDP